MMSFVVIGITPTTIFIETPSLRGPPINTKESLRLSDANLVFLDLGECYHYYHYHYCYVTIIIMPSYQHRLVFFISYDYFERLASPVIVFPVRNPEFSISGCRKMFWAYLNESWVHAANNMTGIR